MNKVAINEDHDSYLDGGWVTDEDSNESDYTERNSFSVERA